MPTTEIPFGGTVYDPAVNHETAGNRYFRGNYLFNPPIDYSALVVEHSSYTNVDAMSSDDSTTYTSNDSAGFNADMQAQYGASDGFLYTEGKQGYAYELSSNTKAVYGTAIVVARDTGQRDLWPGLSGTGSGPNTSTGVVITTPTWTRYEAQLGNGADLLAYPTFRDDLATGALKMTLGGGVISTFGVVDVAYLAVRLEWVLGTTAPPCRQFPRDDGLGTSSARRHYPPPRSRQRSNRWAGGYY